MKSGAGARIMRHQAIQLYVRPVCVRANAESLACLFFASALAQNNPGMAPL